MALVVIRPGLFSTIQDQGRPGYRRFGVPVGGALDGESAALANALLGNAPADAVLEWTGIGGSYRAEIPLAAALVGAPFEVSIERADGPTERLFPPQSFDLRPGDVLKAGGSRIGMRGYLAVRGGWRTNPILGSRSSEIPIKAGDVIPAVASVSGVVRRVPFAAVGSLDLERPIRILDGLDGSAELLSGEEFTVDARSDRLGIRLVPVRPGLMDELRAGHAASMKARPSTPVLPGSVQFSGEEIIVLGRAGGTMGGYPVAAQIPAFDLDRLGQARPGSRLKFDRVTLDESREIARVERARIERRAVAVRAALLDPIGRPREAALDNPA